MRRRQLLAAIGGLTAGAVAGCTGRADPDGDTPTGDGETAVTDHRIETVDTGCAGGDTGTATVTRDEGAVRVSGRLRTANPCYLAELAGVDYDAGADRLAVDVTATPDPEAGACVQCVGAVAYEATVDLAGPLPATVVVSHGGETVARA